MSVNTAVVTGNLFLLTLLESNNNIQLFVANV